MVKLEGDMYYDYGAFELIKCRFISAYTPSALHPVILEEP